jgi:hypothetical protein
VLNDLFPLNEWKRRKITQPRMVRPHIVRVGQAKIIVEAMPGGQKLWQMPEMPFAVDGRSIALPFEQISERRFGIVDAVFGLRTERSS